MPSETTEAWVIRKGPKKETRPAELVKTQIQLPPLGDHDILAEPLYGCWEANMTHSLERSPVDICRLRREEEVVLGNAGVVRVCGTGSRVSECKVGDICGMVPIGSVDRYGHMVKVLGYDAPGLMGVMAKRVVWPEANVVPLPSNTKHSYQQWAAFPVRYTTAWENWKLSHRVWQAQFDDDECPTTHVWSWGGGVGLAQLQLAKINGCRAAMISSLDKRLEQISQLGITPVDRKRFPDLTFDAERYESNRTYRAQYLKSENAFLSIVDDLTDGDGVSIFIDNIGAPVFRATVRALGRMGVVTTAGWREGMSLAYNRVAACVNRHAFVHTHGCRRIEGVRSMKFAEKNNWMPPPILEEYAWDEIPRLAADYAEGKLSTYFPIYKINDF